MGTLCANSYRVLFSSLQHYQVVDVSLPSKTDFVKCFLQKISRKRTLNVISFGKTQRIVELRPATGGAISSKKFDERPKRLRMISLCFHVQSFFFGLLTNLTGAVFIEQGLFFCPKTSIILENMKSFIAHCWPIHALYEAFFLSWPWLCNALPI